MEEKVCTRKVLFEKYRPAKSKNVWTFEMAQDLMAYTMLDTQREIEKDMIDSLTATITAEMNRKIFQIILERNANNRF